MSDSADSTLDVLIKLGVIGQQDVLSAQQLLQEMKSATPGMGGTGTNLPRDAEIAIDATKGQNLKLEDSSRLFAGINGILPGIGHGLPALFEGPIGTAILLASATLEVKRRLKDYHVGRHKAGGPATSVHQSAITRNEAVEKQIENLEAIIDAQLESSQKIVEALVHREVARMPVDYATSPKFALIEEHSHNEGKFIGQTKPYDPAANARKVEPATTKDLEDFETLHQLAAQDLGTVSNAFNAPSGNQSSGDLTAGISLTEPQKRNIDTRILNRTSPLQQAFDGFEQRMAQVEAAIAKLKRQMNQTPQNNS